MHKLLPFLLLLLTLAACSQTKVLPPDELIAAGATLQQVDSSYSFTEGPAVDKAGNVFFTDQPNDRILKWSTDGTIEVFMDGAGRSNGLFFDHDGDLLAAADAENELWSISMDGEVTVLLSDLEGRKFNGPNDLWVAPDGGIYFTDPFYKRAYWTREEKEIEVERVYYLPPDRQSVRVAADNFVRPNGIIGTPDGKTLYVADIGDRKTYRFRIGSDASLSDPVVFAEMGSDGMTLDAQGNLYLTGRGVTVFNPAGEQILQIPVDQRWTANVTFGGKDRKTLFITAMNSVYTLAMNVRGAY